MIINKSGITIRVHARDISVQGRARRACIIDLKKRGDEIVSVCQVLTEEDSDEEAFDAESLPKRIRNPIREEEGTKSDSHKSSSTEPSPKTIITRHTNT